MMSKIVKVCVLTSAHPDSDVRIFHKQCAHLASIGFEITLIVPNTTSRVEKNVSILSFQGHHHSRWKRMIKTVNTVYDMAKKVDADIYHIHDPELLRIAIKLKKSGKKVIYDAHEDLPRQVMSKNYLKPWLRGLISRMIENYENRVSKKLDGIIAATPFIQERFHKLNSNTIDINNFPILDELVTDHSSTKSTDNYICYVGAISKTRGISELISALDRTPAKLLLAGKFNESELHDQLKKLPVWQRVIELGFVGRQGVKDIYQKSKIGIVTLHPTDNYLDSLPVKMFEYMAAGLPVICSDFPLWRSIIQENSCGLCVDPMNSQEIAEAINYLISNPIEAQRMGENGRKLVIEQYNWNNEAEKLTSFYNRLISDIITT